MIVLVTKPLLIALGDANFGAVHEEAGDQQHRGDDQADELVQLRAVSAQQVKTRNQQRAEHEGVGDEEQPQADAVGAQFIGVSCAALAGACGSTVV